MLRTRLALVVVFALLLAACTGTAKPATSGSPGAVPSLGAGEKQRGVHEGIAAYGVRDPDGAVPQLLELGRQRSCMRRGLEVEAERPDADPAELHRSHPAGHEMRTRSTLGIVAGRAT